MFIRARLNYASRAYALMTLVCCLFWNTIGISTHNHDLEGVTGSAGKHAIASRSVLPQYVPSTSIAPVADNDICPGCSFDAASVSGALASFSMPEFPSATVIVPALAVRLSTTSPVGIASRGPPAA